MINKKKNSNFFEIKKKIRFFFCLSWCLHRSTEYFNRFQMQTTRTTHFYIQICLLVSCKLKSRLHLPWLLSRQSKDTNQNRRTKMISNCFFLIATLVIQFVCSDAKDDNCPVCPKTPKIYQELGCIGKLDENGCCFDRFVHSFICWT